MADVMKYHLIVFWKDSDKRPAADFFFDTTEEAFDFLAELDCDGHELSLFPEAIDETKLVRQ